MKLIKVMTSLGTDSYINVDSISFLREGKFGGTEIHFDKGNVLAVHGSVAEVVGELNQDNKDNTNTKENISSDYSPTTGVLNFTLNEEPEDEQGQ